MKKIRLIIVCAAMATIIISGCVERRLTISTEPAGAKVILNDEYIGTSPATVSFNWYGDYSVRLEKDGFETLRTHKNLKAPWYDYFPFDFLSQIIPQKKIDTYNWTFKLATAEPISREQLIEQAQQIRGNL